ncbi:hypothetical protein BgiBS90_033657 [Biomphalaria glabrata]|nr:hypothetical protein BgiBS90_033657 [Biomphalaria glabrata]
MHPKATLKAPGNVSKTWHYMCPQNPENPWKSPISLLHLSRVPYAVDRIGTTKDSVKGAFILLDLYVCNFTRLLSEFRICM